jgi:hypothetical protein
MQQKSKKLFKKLLIMREKNVKKFILFLCADILIIANAHSSESISFLLLNNKPIFKQSSLFEFCKLDPNLFEVKDIKDEGLALKQENLEGTSNHFQNQGINGRRDFYFIPKRLSLRTIQKKRIGYRRGYATADVFFAPSKISGHMHSMIDLRAHWFDNNTYAANLGLIERYIPSSSCRVLGFNGYYDFREGSLGNYHRLGLGLELLGSRWDFRLNGYVPVGLKKHKIKCVFDQYIGGYVATLRRKEFAFYGFNAEIGVYALKVNNFFLYVAGGPYFLSKETSNTSWGGKLRVRPQFRDYLALELSTSYDNIFKNIYQAEIIFSLPLYRIIKTRKENSSCVSDYQFYQPVQRFEIIPIEKRCCWNANF